MLTTNSRSPAIGQRAGSASGMPPESESRPRYHDGQITMTLGPFCVACIDPGPRRGMPATRLDTVASKFQQVRPTYATVCRGSWLRAPRRVGWPRPLWLVETLGLCAKRDGERRIVVRLGRARRDIVVGAFLCTKPIDFEHHGVHKRRIAPRVPKRRTLRCLVSRTRRASPPGCRATSAPGT